MKRDKTPVVLVVTPHGIGGITTMTESMRDAWPYDNPKLVLFRVPRHSFRGWINYPFSLLSFTFLLLIRNVKVCHVNLSTGGSPIRKFAYILVARALGVPIVLQVHSGKFHTVLASSSTSRIWKAIVKASVHLATGILALNNQQILFLQDQGFSSSKPIHFLPNAIPIRVEDRTHPLEQEKNFDFVFVGRVSEEKGAVDLLNSLKLIRNQHLSLAVVGKYELSFGAEQFLKEASPHKITLFGEVSRTEVDHILRQSRALVLPSHVENFPMVILEGFRAKIPAIATNVGETSAMVVSDKTGRLIPAFSPETLADALITYFLDNGKCMQEGLNGFHKLESSFDIEKYPAKLLHAYKNLGVRF
jgi:glycosyltransferase involved in cell wall biosynthesis